MPSKEEMKRGGRVQLWSSQCGALLISSLFESTQYARLKNLCGLYPWTINLLAMYNMGGVGGSVREASISFQEGEKKPCTWVKKWHFLMSAWHGGTTLKAITAGKHTNLKNCTTLNMFPGLWHQHKKTYCFGCYLRKRNKKSTPLALKERWNKIERLKKWPWSTINMCRLLCWSCKGLTFL